MIRITEAQLSKKHTFWGFSKIWIVDASDHGRPDFQEKHTFLGFSKFWFVDDPDHGILAFQEKNKRFSGSLNCF
jgi:hypothetical protein